MLKSNPCVECGACCAFFRVSFLRDNPEGAVAAPVECTETLDDTRSCMKGTNQKDPQCVCLEGEIGVAAQCGIYEARPRPCRKFGVEWKENVASIREHDYIHCNRARHHWGLPRLSRRRISVIPSESAQQEFEELP